MEALVLERAKGLAPAKQTMKRTDYHFVQNAFDPNKLREVANHLSTRFSGQHPGSAREQKRVFQGVATDEVRFDPKWNEVWERASETLLAVLANHLFVIYPNQMRFICMPRHLVPWHQDSMYVKSKGMPLTCFVPLDDDPANRSTLMFAEWDGGEIPHAPEDKYGGYELDQQFTDTEYFNLSLGDCLVFGDLCPHKTFVPQGCNISRRSLEFRLLGEDQLQAGHDYFSIAENKLIHVP